MTGMPERVVGNDTEKSTWVFHNFGRPIAFVSCILYNSPPLELCFFCKGSSGFIVSSIFSLKIPNSITRRMSVVVSFGRWAVCVQNVYIVSATSTASTNSRQKKFSEEWHGMPERSLLKLFTISLPGATSWLTSETSTHQICPEEWNYGCSVVVNISNWSNPRRCEYSCVCDSQQRRTIFCATNHTNHIKATATFRCRKPLFSSFSVRLQHTKTSPQLCMTTDSRILSRLFKW